jgi:hypothetical protein
MMMEDFFSFLTTIRETCDKTKNKPRGLTIVSNHSDFFACIVLEDLCVLYTKSFGVMLER